MFEITQTITVGDGSGREGNCLQACVASLLDLPLVDVPHFLEAPDWWRVMVEFGAAHGYEVRHADQPPVVGLAFGPSPRGVSHSVVVRDGEIDWDPHPSRDGLLSVSTYVEFGAAS